MSSGYSLGKEIKEKNNSGGVFLFKYVVILFALKVLLVKADRLVLLFLCEAY